MTLIELDWLTGLILVLMGMLAGGYLVRLYFSDAGKERQLRDQLEASRRELTDYRTKVSSHFRDTARAVNQMTESYRQVHEQLSGGAQELCDDLGAELVEPCTPALIEQPAGTAPEPEPPGVAGEAQEAAESAPSEPEPVADSTSQADEAATEEEVVDEPAEAAVEEPKAPLDYASDAADDCKTVH